MSGSGFFRLDEAVPDVAVGYLPRESDAQPWRSNIYQIPVIGGADGGAFSTTADLDAFLTALTDGTLLGDLQDTVLIRHVDIGEGYAMGYGVYFRPDGSIGHGGGDPGVETYSSRFRDEDVNAVVLCSMEDCVGDVYDLLLEAWRS
jgi:D-alanyl-D-alanine carboxypeptidase